jgi:hypothetical protein
MTNAEHQKRWRQKHPEAAAANSRAYRERHRTAEQNFARERGRTVRGLFAVMRLQRDHADLWQAVAAGKLTYRTALLVARQQRRRRRIAAGSAVLKRFSPEVVAAILNRGREVGWSRERVLVSLGQATPEQLAELELTLPPGASQTPRAPAAEQLPGSH